MKPAVVAVAILAAAALGGPCGQAQGATPSPNAASLATREAKAITLRDMQGHGTIGTLQLTPIGRTRTRVTLQFTGINAAKSVVTLHRGEDCTGPVAQPLTLNPANSASQVSQTIVDLPLSDLQSGNYLVDVRNQTQTAQFAQACARVAR